MYAWQIRSSWTTGIIIARNAIEAVKKWNAYTKKSAMQPTMKSAWGIKEVVNLGEILGR